MALSGSYKIKISNTSSTPNEWLQLSWTVNSQSVETNKSNITFAIQIYSTYSSAYQPYSIDSSSEKTVSLSVNGTRRYYAHNDQWGANPVVIDFRGTSASNPATLGSWTGNISHADDGTSNAISLAGELFYGDTETSHAGLTGDHQISYTIPAGAINAIARASVPTCPSTSEFGSTIKITTNRASSSFTHKLTFSCNGHSQTVNDVGASYNFTIPASWAPTDSDTSKTLTVTCVTYNGSSNLGSNTCSSTVAVPSTWVPSVSISYSLSPSGDFLANITTATLTATGTATYYASIQTYSWSGGSVSGSGATKTHSPTAAGTYTYTVTVTDSRGRTGTATLRLTCIDSSSSITLSASSLYFGGNITATLVPKKSTFRHVLSYTIGEYSAASDISLAAGNLSATQTIPVESAAAIPTTKSGTLTVTAKVYNGNTLVGSSSATAKIKIPTAWLPTTGTITIHDYQSSKFNDQYLQNHSRIYVRLAGLAASTGSTLKTVRYLGQDLDYTRTTTPIPDPTTKASKVFSASGTFTYDVTVTDARGLSASGTSPSVTVVPYSFPTVTITAHRCTSQGEPNDFGEYVQAYLNGTWGSSVTGNSWSAYIYKREYGDTNDPVLVWSVTNQTGSISVDSTPIAASVNSAFEFMAIITDAVGHSSEQAWTIISTGNVLVDLYKDKLVSLFKTASADLMTDLGMTTNDNIAYADGTTFLNGRTYIPANGSDDGFTDGWERIGPGGGTPVQSDWNESDSSAADYIKNKPGYAAPNTPGLISTSSQWMSGSKGADGISTTESFTLYRSNDGGQSNRMGRIQMHTETVNNKDVGTRMYLRQYSYDSSTGDHNGVSEYYRLPIVDSDKSSSTYYDIITSKTFSVENASVSMFGSFAVCGASWDSGYVYYDGSSVIERDYLSWGANVARRNGNVCKVFSRHSMTTRSYLTNAYCLPALLKDTACGMYYIGLGGNDSSSLGLSYLGTIADITNDYTQNPDTFYGNYARIVEQIQGKAPNAKIICAMWYNSSIHDSTREAFYNAMVAIAEHYSLPHFNWDDDPWYTTNVNSGLVQNHPTEAQLSGIAACFERIFSKLVSNYYNSFKHYRGSDFEDRTLFSGTFKNTSSTVTLAGATRYQNITFMGRTGSNIDINASVTIPVANISTSAINHMISDPLSYFAFSLTKSDKDVLLNYVSETTAGSGKITRIYWS